MSDPQDSQLQALFAESNEHLQGDDFVAEVLQQTGKANRRAILARIGLAALWALAGIPLQPFAMDLAAVLMVQLVSLEAGLVSVLLAPINSVATLLALALFFLRAVHRRLFVRS